MVENEGRSETQLLTLCSLSTYSPPAIASFVVGLRLTFLIIIIIIIVFFEKRTTKSPLAVRPLEPHVFRRLFQNSALVLYYRVGAPGGTSAMMVPVLARYNDAKRRRLGVC
jgi:hypothetical protein